MTDVFARLRGPNFGLWKLVSSVTFVIALVLAVFVGARVFYDEGDQVRLLQNRAAIVAQRVAAAVSPTIWNVFEKSIDRRYSADVASAILDSELLDPAIFAIIVDGNFGHVFMGKVRVPDGSTEFYDREKHSAVLQTPLVSAVKGIQQGTMTIGTVRVMVQKASFGERLYQGLIFDLFQIFMIVGTIAAALVFVINRTLIEPTRELAISKQAFESLSDGLYVTDPNGSLFESNPASMQFSGEAPENSEMFAPPFTLVDEELQAKLCLIWKNQSPDQFWQGEVEVRSSDDVVIPAQISISQVKDGGKDTGFKLTVIRDLTAQKQYEVRLKELVDEASTLKEFAQQANQSKSEFLANMSHELRTPLNAIIGFSDMMRMDSIKLSDEKEKEYIESVHLSASHLLGIINDILDLSKIEAGQVEVTFENVDLQMVIDESVSFFEHQLSERGAAIELDVAEVILRTDSRILKQILLNVLSNSIKFSPTNSKISLSLEVKGTEVEIQITDEGPGIPEDKLASVMEPFMQVDNSYGRIHQGTGLGLSLVARFARLLGGEFLLRSVVGKGTTAIIKLPSVSLH